MELTKEKEQLAYFMRRLYEQRLTTTSGGNVSLRVGDNILITPSQTDKARMFPESIGSLSIDGEILTPGFKSSMESKMHLSIYHSRPDIKAIVHAHPVFATSFAIANREIKTNLGGEARAILGEPVRAKYALMGTQELADIVGDASINGNVILMENHGIIALGKTLLEAYDRMEVMEATAKITLITDMLGGGKGLSTQELYDIDNLFL